MQPWTSTFHDGRTSAELCIVTRKLSGRSSIDVSTILGAAPRYDSKIPVLLALRAAPQQRRQHGEVAAKARIGAASFGRRKVRFVKKKALGASQNHNPGCKP